MISPVFGFITSSATATSSSLLPMPSFLLYLYLPTFETSYRLESKNNEPINAFALSSVGGSPGRSFLYISCNASTGVMVVSFSSDFKSLSSSPNKLMISSSEARLTPSREPNLALSAGMNKSIAFSNTVIGCFLVLSTLTEIISLVSVSYSSQAPLLGITVVEKRDLPDLSISLL